MRLNAHMRNQDPKLHTSLVYLKFDNIEQLHFQLVSEYSCFSDRHQIAVYLQ